MLDRGLAGRGVLNRVGRVRSFGLPVLIRRLVLRRILRVLRVGGRSWYEISGVSEGEVG